MSGSSRQQNKLSDSFSQEMARKRAHELGVSPEDLVQKVVNGQAVWVLKTEVFADLDKQRKLASSSKVIRSIRGGENSLYGLIRANIGHARRLLEEIGAADIWNPIERHDSLSSITNVERRGNEAAAHLTELEDEIEKVKQTDPIHADAEKVLSEMRQAQLDGRNDAITEIRRAHADLLARYQQRRKAIEPQIQSTRNYRQALQKECWKIMLIVWGLRDVLIDSLEKMLNHAHRRRFNEAKRGQFEEDIRFIAVNRKSLESRCRKTSVRRSSAQDGAFHEWNEVLDALRTLLQEQTAFYKDCQAIASKYNLSDASGANARQRMAFSQRNNGGD